MIILGNKQESVNMKKEKLKNNFECVPNTRSFGRFYERIQLVSGEWHRFEHRNNMTK